MATPPPPLWKAPSEVGVGDTGTLRLEQGPRGRMPTGVRQIESVREAREENAFLNPVTSPNCID